MLPRASIQTICARLAVLLGVAAMFAGVAAATANAQALEFSRSYVTPFPPGDRYRVLVLGDSLADGIWSGLTRNFQTDSGMEIVKKARGSTGLARPDAFDWGAELDTILKSETAQIAVVMIGVNDDQQIRTKAGPLKIGSEAWRTTYGQRVEDFTRKLKAKNIAVYWVGLPIMRSPDQNDDMQMLNEVFREKAFINGAKFIDTWNGFADQFGRYSAYGPDMSGQVKRLRADDGIHFTERGYEKLAHFVEREVKRDLTFAKAERNIPLAGNEDEQTKAVGRLGFGKAQGRAAGAAERAPGSTDGTPSTQAHQSAHAKGEIEAPTPNAAPKAEVVKVEGVEIKRPPLPESAIAAAQGLTPQNAASALPDGENIASELGNGLTALATISPVNDSAAMNAKRGVPLAERAYYRVLIKGEQLKPKAGRADDFAWPKGAPAEQAKAPETHPSTE